MPAVAGDLHVGVAREGDDGGLATRRPGCAPGSSCRCWCTASVVDSSPSSAGVALVRLVAADQQDVHVLAVDVVVGGADRVDPVDLGREVPVEEPHHAAAPRARARRGTRPRSAARRGRADRREAPAAGAGRGSGPGRAGRSRTGPPGCTRWPGRAGPDPGAGRRHPPAAQPPRRSRRPTPGRRLAACAAGAAGIAAAAAAGPAAGLGPRRARGRPGRGAAPAARGALGGCPRRGPNVGGRPRGSRGRSLRRPTLVSAPAPAGAASVSLPRETGTGPSMLPVHLVSDRMRRARVTRSAVAGAVAAVCHTRRRVGAGPSADRPQFPSTEVRALMRMLVTGGAGFIGSHYVRTLLAGGYPGFEDAEVTVLDKLTYAGNLANLAPVADDPRLPVRAGRHLRRRAARRGAARPRRGGPLRRRDRTSTGRSSARADFVLTNVLGTQTLLRGRAATPASAGSCTSPPTRSTARSTTGSWTEDARRCEPNSPYSAAKAGGDLIARAYARTHGLPTSSITRCSNNYGPYQFPEKVIPLFVTNLIDGRAGAAVRRRRATSATGCTSTTTAAASSWCSSGGRAGRGLQHRRRHAS